MSKRVVGQKRTPSVRQEQGLLCRLESDGMTEEDAQAVIQSRGNKLAKKLLGVIRGTLVRAVEEKVGASVPSVIEMTPSQLAAQKIMRKNVFGIAEAMKHYKVKPTKKELKELETVRFSEEKMRACAKTHLLVADFGLSVMDVWKQHCELFCCKIDPWYGNWCEAKWARKRVKAQWRLLRKTAVPDSFGKDLAKQEEMLGKGEEVPEAREMVYMVIGHYLATGEKLFSDYYVRRRSLSGAGSRIVIGRFDALGLLILSWDGNPNDDVGLASSCLPAEAR